tara:strand:+ start:173 stop:1585 length:1413 start_codon:yes stop_codon:yes gene_type:complete
MKKFFHKNFYSRILKALVYFILIAFILSCSGPDSEDFEDDSAITYNSDEENAQRLPDAIISTLGEEIVDEPKINATLTLIEEDLNETNYSIGIEIRGSSSQMFDKKSYGFETRSADFNDDVDVSLGGFPEEEDWIFYGPYTDKSLIRNKLTFDLSNLIGYKASNTKFYNLTINDDFKGIYILMEKIKRDKNRVDITKHSGSSPNGGYIVKIDKPTGDGGLCGTCYDNSFSFRSNYDSNGNLSSGSEIYFVYDYPKPDDISSEQKEYIQTYINDFESNLLSDNFNDLENGYLSYIDLDSFINFFIINEITKNIDGYRLSTFLNKDVNAKLKMGPIWDFNLAFGNADYCNGWVTSGWGYKFNDICSGDVWQVPFWWNRLMESPKFKEELKIRWNSLRSNLLSNQSVMNKIDEYSNYLNERGAVYQNFSRWDVLGRYIWPNKFIASTHEEEIDFMKDWINDRFQWLDESISGL